mgnify:FL=1
MALTYANTTILFRGSMTLLYTEATFDTAYATSGESVLPESFGLREINMVVPASCEGFSVDWTRTSPTAGLLQMFAHSASTNTSTEMASGVDRSGITCDLLIIGR